ncbi:MAG: diheme cytochrome c [Betaproteobacteria bacterium]|nr:diheme cytochrome c [Betaproteobacteria bacterium]
MNVERKRLPFVLAAWMTVPLLTLLLLAVDVEAKTRRFTADSAIWRAECSGCHVAYPPALLPAADWRQLMGSLTRHFGADASVDPSVATEIDRFLAANAGRGESRATEAQPRITTTRWFRHKHDEVSAAVFRSPSVETAANCAACHPGAATGAFNEHAVRIPH